MSSLRLLVVIVALVAILPNAMAFEEGRTEYGAPLRLTCLPARVWISAPVPGFYDGGIGAATRAMNTWNAANDSGTLFSLTNDSRQALIEIRFVNTNWKFGSVVAAHTDVVSDPFHGDIRRVVIEIDGSRRFSEAHAPAVDALDLETILLHELGHAVGLRHSRNQQAIMRAGIKLGHEPRRVLHDDDVAAIRSVVRKATTVTNGSSLAAQENYSRNGWMIDAIWAIGAAAFYLVGSGIHSRKRLMP